MNYLSSHLSSNFPYEHRTSSVNWAKLDEREEATKAKFADELTKSVHRIIHSPHLDQGADILVHFLESPQQLSNLLNKDFKKQYPKIHDLVSSLHLDKDYRDLVKKFSPSLKNFLLNTKNLISPKHNQVLHEFSLLLANTITNESKNEFGDKIKIKELLNNCNRVFENCSTNLEMIKLAQDICIKKPHFISETLDIWKNFCERLDVKVGFKICLASELLKLISKFIPRNN